MKSLKEALINEIMWKKDDEKYREYLETLNDKQLQSELERVIMGGKHGL